MTISILEGLVRDSEARGWAVAELNSSAYMLNYRLSREARELGWEPIENRSGEDPVSILKPMTQAEAHPASISAQTGLGQQPLHTDGAHLRRVPDFVVLWSIESSATPTRIWDPSGAIARADRDGIFSVTSGADTWLAPAWDGSLRFDPGCMAPLDAFARRLATALQEPPDGAVDEIHWENAGKVLLLRNRRVLHGRAKLAEGDTARRLGRIAFYQGEKK